MTRVAVRVPRSLASSYGGERSLEVEGGTVREALADAIRLNPLLGTHLFAEDGSVREHLHVFLNEDDVRSALDSATREGDEIVILQAMSGGSPAAQERSASA
jgi:sulfur-carrier protein